MFTDYINDLTICGDEAAEVFPGIQKIFKHPDNSFLATLRAILPPRMLPGDVLSFGLEHFNLDGNFHAQTDTKKIQSLFFHAETYKNCLIVNSVENIGNDILDTVKLKASEICPAYTYLPEVSYYLSQKGGRKAAFISNKDRSAVVIGVAISLSDWHYIQTNIPTLLPWYFTEPRTADDNAILHSLTRADSKDYINTLERISMGMDLRVIKIKKMLSGIADDYKQDRIYEVECKLESLELDIERLNQEISRKISEKYESLVFLCGLQNIEDTQNIELVDFFIKNKALHIVSTEKGVVEYIATGYLISYEQQIFEKYLTNKNSVLYTKYANAKITTEETERLLKAIFNPNPVCKLRVCAAFALKLDGDLSPKTGYSFPDWLNEYFPHPHIDRMGCLGGNTQYINQAMMNQDYLMAITQTMAAIRNINFADSGVVAQFMERFCTKNPKCIEMRNGDILRPSDAVKLLDSMGR